MKLFGNQITTNAKTRFTLALCTVVALSASPLRADDDKQKDQGSPGRDSTTATGHSSQFSNADEKWVRESAQSGQMEVHMGKIGLQKSQNSQVKQFSQRLIDDHSKANAELKQIASSKGLMLPEAPDQISRTTEDTDRTRVREKEDALGEHRAHLKKLQSYSATEFDREFAKMAVKHHEKDVKEFEKASEKADDPALRAFAAKTLPTLREHLQHAKTLESQVSGVGAPDSATGTEAGTSSGVKTESDPAK
jgi:putative membrane protein